MKIIGYEYGRVTLLMDVLELGPRWGIFWPKAISLVQSAFSFAVIPAMPTVENNQQCLRFEHGFFVHDEKEINIRIFEIWPQGLIAQAADTDAAELFIRKLFDFGKSSLGLVKPESTDSMFFASSLVVEFKNDANRFISAHAELASRLSSAIQLRYRINRNVELGRISWRVDPESVSNKFASSVPDFVLERRVNTPFEKNRFLALAPLPTDEHIQLLQGMEEIALM